MERWDRTVAAARLAARLLLTGVAATALVATPRSATAGDARRDTLGPSSASRPPCDGVRVAARRNLAAVTARHPGGTTFCLAAGRFVLTRPVRSQPGDTFIGAGARKTFIRPAGKRITVGFVPTGSTDGDAPVTYKHLDIGGFSAALRRDCDGSVIECGVALVLSSDTSGVAGGVVVEDVRCHSNGVACASGGSGSFRAAAFNCFRNGFHPSTRSGPYVSNTCVKVTEGSIIVRNSFIHDNYAVGLWCDFCGHTRTVIENNRLVGNGRVAIQWEVSGHFGPGDSALVRNNVIRRNGVACGTRHGFILGGGILVSNATNITIEDNTFRANVACSDSGVTGMVTGRRAVRIYDNDSRAGAPDPHALIRRNRLNGGAIQFCSMAGVTCARNRR